jgi:PAS domain S-box-containing protein
VSGLAAAFAFLHPAASGYDERPHPRAGEPMDERSAAHSTQAALDAMAARSLGVLLAALGTLVLASALLQYLGGFAEATARGRALAALAMLAATFVATALQRRGRARSASGLVLVVVLAASGLQAAVSGRGLDALMLAGATTGIIIVGGLVGGMRLALLLAAVDAVVVGVLFVGEEQGWVARGADDTAPRLLRHALLIAAGLAAAQVATRLFAASVGRAREGERRMEALLEAERRTQHELQGSQAMVDRLVRLSPDAIVLARLTDGRVLLANPAFEQLAGLPMAQIVGKSAVELGLWREPEQALRLRDALRSEGVVRGMRSEGYVGEQRRVVQLSAASFEAEGVPMAVITVRDITEVEQARLDLADAKRQAEAANDAKSAFLATMSHEIRTPLNGVLGLARLLQEPALDEARRREYLSHLVDAAELLGGIVSDVLDLSKIEAGHLQIEHIAFDLPGLVEGAFRTFAPLGRERGLGMSCLLDPALPQRVRGDPVRVRQILANYLGNALKFTGRGEIELVARAVAPGRVRIEVRDTGVGVSPEVRETLFRPFAQADSSTTRRFGGTGLGLSICRELAERMGGSVGVDSDGTHGSTFWAELALPAEKEAQPAPAVAAEPPRPLAGRTLLVAEDNAVNMLIVGATLRRLGADVLEAADGEEAVRVALQHGSTLSAVLMDLHMPALDGLAATRRLRADARTAALPIYALSAAVLEHERDDASAAGMNGFIAKPVVEADLLRVLQ